MNVKISDEKLLKRLSKKALTADELAKEFGVHVETMRLRLRGLRDSKKIVSEARDGTKRLFYKTAEAKQPKARA